MKRTRILIVDDHPIVREGFKKILADAPELAAEDEAGNGQEALQALEAKVVGLVLLDIAMPGRNGLEVLKDIKTKHPQIPVIMVSMYSEDHFAVRAFKSGASGYLAKTSAPGELVGAVRKVLQGGRYITPALAEQLTFYLNADMEKPPHERLSDREYQVMLMIASGATLTQIAVDLALSIKTVSTYRTHILDKMKMKNNVEITLYAVRQHLIG